MRGLWLLMAGILASGTAFAGEGGIAQALFQNGDPTLGAARAGLDDPMSFTTDVSVRNAAAGTVNSGKAMLLSAIVPGTGQYYAGKTLKAAVFLGVELAAWGTVIYFYNKGQDKDQEFRDYADAHFDESNYRAREYSLATNPAYGDSGGYRGTPSDWENEPWDVKIHYLPREGFTHELPTREQRENNWSDKQQYYEMIGKYIHQFGFGWYDGIGDDPGTPYFDGRSPRSEHYMDMRHDANQLLKTSAWGYNIALLNHVVSALDASFTVRMMNREVKTEVGFRQVPYNGEMAPAGGLHIVW